MPLTTKEARLLFSPVYGMSPYGIYVVNGEKKIIYKNKLAQKFAPNVRLGALLKTYTCLDTESDLLTQGEFSGKEYTVFVHRTTVEDEKISIIFLTAGKMIAHELTAEVIDFYNAKLSEISYQSRTAIGSLRNCGDRLKKNYLDLLANNVERLQCFTDFAQLFMNNACKCLPDEKKTYNISLICQTIHDRIVSRVRDLDIVFDIDVKSNTLLSSLNIRHLIYILLYSLYFCIKNSAGKKITLEVLENAENGIVRFLFDDKYKLIDQYQENVDNQTVFSFSQLCDNNIFMPLYSIARLCEKNDISLLFCKSNHRETMKTNRFALTFCFSKSDALPEVVLLEEGGVSLSEIDILSQKILSELFVSDLEDSE